MSLPLRVLVLSDLHVGRKARSRDLCPYPDAALVQENYLDRFLRFATSVPLKADVLVLPGDISDRAHPEEFAHVNTLLLEISKRLRIPRKMIFFAPGNHDVDWEVLRHGDLSGMRLQQRYDPIRRANTVLGARHRQREAGGNLYSEPYYCIWETPGVLCISINTASDDGPGVATHHGTAPQETLDALDKALAKRPASHGQVRLALGHHHPFQYSDPLPDEPDFSAMTNAENLLAVLRTHRFDIVVHGHKHAPHCRTDMDTLGRPLLVLGAGSFSAELPSRWSGVVTNQVHLIEVQDRDAVTQGARGVVRSWSFLSGHGWGSASLIRGLRHSVPFGVGFGVGELAPRLRSVLTVRLPREGYVKWPSVCVAGDRDLRYLAFEAVLEVLKELSKELLFTIHGDSLEELILLKG